MRFLVLVASALVLAGCGSAPKLLPEVATPELETTASISPQAAEIGPATPRAYSAMVVDLKTGAVLHEENAQAVRYPASLTKMMTLFLLFEDIKAGKISSNTAFKVSQNAASKPPSKLGLKPGETIRARQAAQALAVKSANDVATVVAENLSGTEQAFAIRMNRTARALGMTQTRFVNPSGLPDTRQVSTARDMAILGRALKLRHPRYSRFFSAREFRYGGRNYKATNKLLGKVRGVDGIKTGYIRLSGYNLVASAKRGRKQIIVVVIGGKSGRARNAQVTKLIERYL